MHIQALRTIFNYCNYCIVFNKIRQICVFVVPRNLYVLWIVVLFFRGAETFFKQRWGGRQKI